MEKITLMLFLFWCCLKNLVVPFSDLSNNETSMYQYRTKLYEKMLKTYDKRILPQCTEDPVDVTIELAPKEIVNVQENQESAKFQLWVRLSWFDCNLVWNKSTHGNISSITVPNDDIWIPDLTLVEDIDYVANMPQMKQFRALVTSDGNVHFNFLTVVNIICPMNLTYYPYDIQMCNFTFLSWIHTSKEVHIYASSDLGDLENFSPNQEFIVTEVTAINVKKDYPCCGGFFSQVTYTIKMKRRPVFFMATIVVPFFIITIISLVGFALPSISGEKITFHTTILLATVVFLLLVQDQFPSTSETFPKIAVYFTIAMILSCVSCVMSAIVMYIYYNDLSGMNMNKWIRQIFIVWMGKIMFVKERNVPLKANGQQKADTMEMRPRVSGKEFRKRGESRKTIKGFTRPDCLSIYEEMNNDQSTNGVHGENTQRDQENETFAKVRFQEMQSSNYSSSTTTNNNRASIYYSYEDFDPPARRMNDWELLAYTLDRFFTVFYVFMTVLNSMVFLIIMNSHDTL
nr:neuronal acetylcholine receptor subunit alpha-9 [Crassostrea gigas]